MVCLGKEWAESGSSGFLRASASSGFAIAHVTLHPPVIVTAIASAGYAFGSSFLAFGLFCHWEVLQTATFNFAVIVAQIAQCVICVGAGTDCSYCCHTACIRFGVLTLEAGESWEQRKTNIGLFMWTRKGLIVTILRRITHALSN